MLKRQILGHQRDQRPGRAEQAERPALETRAAGQAVADRAAAEVKFVAEAAAAAFARRTRRGERRGRSSELAAPPSPQLHRRRHLQDSPVS